MSKQEERVLVKDDSALFSLVRRLTEEQPSVEWSEWEQEVLVPIEIPFFVLLNAADRLSVDKARILYQRLEKRLPGTVVSGQQNASGTGAE